MWTKAAKVHKTEREKAAIRAALARTKAKRALPSDRDRNGPPGPLGPEDDG